MKNKLLALAILSLMLVALAGCGGGETTVSAPPERSATEEKAAEEPAEPTSIDYDNRALASNDKVDVALKEISHEGITFTITNKTSEILTLSNEGLAFDGQCIYTGNYAVLHEELVPNTTVEVLVPYELNNIEHKTMSGAFDLLRVDEDGSGWSVGTLSFNNIDLGYEEYPIWNYPSDTDPQSGQVLYEDDRLTLRFYRIMDTMFAATVENKSSEYFQARFTSFVVNGKSIDRIDFTSAHALPGCEAIFMIEPLDMNLESEIEPGSTISGVIQLFGQDHSGAGKVSFNMTVE